MFLVPAVGCKEGDLNSIEMVWDKLDCRGKKKQPTLLQDCWKTITGDELMKVTKRMPRVCTSVIKTKRWLL